MSSNLTVVVLGGTTRENALSNAVVEYIAAYGRQLDGVDIIVARPGDFTFFGDGNDSTGRDAHYTDLTARADAFFIVVPEYNHSFPGSLKRMLDSEYANYIHKPVAFAGVSNGAWGGVRAVESLVPAVREMGLVATSWSSYFPRVQDIFTAEGEIHPEHKTVVDKTVAYAYSELLWMAKALRWGRENLS